VQAETWENQQGSHWAYHLERLIAPMTRETYRKPAGFPSFFAVSRSIMWFTLTFRGRSQKSSFAILPDCVSMLRQESAPRKVTMNP
jgi:hypothetical protein